MTRARSSLVCPEETPYYHCVGRCVRQAFLCGRDPVSGKSFDHRKSLILARLKLLTEVFAVDLCAYALMSNHYHLVLRIVPARAAAWTEREVIERWRMLFLGPAYASQYLDGGALNEDESALLSASVARWRSRLSDLSWFMRCLNEYVARLANREDGAKGRFWEGRFKSQALLDEAALLTAMAYVDLNPVRAGLADSIPTSRFTSGQQRLEETTGRSPISEVMTKPRLMALEGSEPPADGPALPFNTLDYLDLLDTSGRMVHPTKPGRILDTVPPLLLTLNLNPGEWFRCLNRFRGKFRLFMGSPHRLFATAKRRGCRWIWGQTAAQRLYTGLRD